MFTRRTWVVLAVMAALLAAFMVSCGPKPPCPVAPEVVREAQAQTEQVEGDLAEATAEREALEKELSEKEAKLGQLKGKPEELNEKLEALKKGSGR
jgi:septal ring factor EnvC (AmiA/AmiB activator)